jgi:hypothetical protein
VAPNVRDVAPDLSVSFATVLQQAMDRDPNRRPATAGELLEQLQSALDFPYGKPESRSWSQPVTQGRGFIGLSVGIVLLVGAAEAAWIFQGSGLTLLTRAVSKVLGFH